MIWLSPVLGHGALPCILVGKPDGTYRFCTDYRKLNSVTKPDCFPLPRVDDCVDQVGAARYVSKFDLLKGYWQVPLTPRARELSAFVTPDNFLQYKVMPSGVRNAPATFQRLINHVLSGLTGCDAYLDDVVVFSSTWPEHLVQIRELFNRLAKANLTVNLAKCEFGKATVTYLGKVVGRGQVHPVGAKVTFTFTFSHLADAFIQSDLQGCIQQGEVWTTLGAHWIQQERCGLSMMLTG